MLTANGNRITNYELQITNCPIACKRASLSILVSRVLFARARDTWRGCAQRVARHWNHYAVACPGIYAGGKVALENFQPVSTGFLMLHGGHGLKAEAGKIMNPAEAGWGSCHGLSPRHECRGKQRHDALLHARAKCHAPFSPRFLKFPRPRLQAI